MLASRDISLLASCVGGSVLTRESDGYDTARAVYNGMIDKHPDVIVLCQSAYDVSECVRFAARHAQPLAVQGGGHNVAGLGTCDGGLLLALQRMGGIRVDGERQIAYAEAGVTWGALDAETQRFGLATTGGIVHDTGIAGLTLGGGLGWLMGAFGLTCDNLASVKAVLADGSALTADDHSHPALMWALRGGGGNFAVVTEFGYRLHPVGNVWAGSLTFDIGTAAAVLSTWKELAEACPDHTTTSPALAARGAAGPRLVVDVCGIAGQCSTEAAISALIPHSTGTTLAEVSYTCWQRAGSDPYRRGLRSYWKSLSLSSLPKRVCEILARRFAVVPSEHTLVTIDHVHGRAARVAPTATAFGRRLPFVILLNSNWSSPTDDRENIAWTRRTYEELYAAMPDSAAYINYLDRDDASRLEQAYGDNIARLRAVKQTYDPTNLFRATQNISPV